MVFELNQELKTDKCFNCGSKNTAVFYPEHNVWFCVECNKKKVQSQYGTSAYK